MEGLSGLLPCEPPPLTQASPSGLARPQQLLAIQASLAPCVPGYSKHQNGLVCS